VTAGVVPSGRSVARYRRPSIRRSSVRELHARRIDLANPDSYVERVPSTGSTSCGAKRPVSWHEEDGPNRGFWAITRYDDLTAVHMDWQTFSVRDRCRLPRGARRGTARDRRSMLETDPPRHSQLRQICSKRLSARGSRPTRTSSVRSRAASSTARSSARSSTSSRRSRASCRSGSSARSSPCPRTTRHS